MPTSPIPPDTRAKPRETSDPDEVTIPAESDQDIDTAGTEADESAVGSALDRGAVERDPRPDRRGARP